MAVVPASKRCAVVGLAKAEYHTSMYCVMPPAGVVTLTMNDGVAAFGDEVLIVGVGIEPKLSGCGNPVLGDGVNCVTNISE